MPLKIGKWWKLSQVDYWFEYVGMSADPRTHHLLYVNTSPLFILWKIFNFVMFSWVLGPEMMRGLPPFHVRWLMFIYNCCMSLINIYAVYNVVPMSNYFRILFDFDYPDRNDMSPRAIHLIHLGYMYWLSKVLDCWDTCFFVVRKKYAHITLLHVYHHTVVPVFGYILMRVNVLTPCVFMFSFVNSTIHVIMYSYYALAALGPWIQPYLWWKKYITILQLWQFVLYGIYGALLLFFGKNYPPFWLYFGLTQPPLFFWLFYDFYMKAYNTKNRSLFQLFRMWTRKRQQIKCSQSNKDSSLDNCKCSHSNSITENKCNRFSSGQISIINANGTNKCLNKMITNHNNHNHNSVLRHNNNKNPEIWMNSRHRITSTTAKIGCFENGDC